MGRADIRWSAAPDEDNVTRLLRIFWISKAATMFGRGLRNFAQFGAWVRHARELTKTSL
jgi:hypothetical protein